MLVDSISAGLSAPTISGLGIATAVASPKLSYEIGQYFKGQDAHGIAANTIFGAAAGGLGNLSRSVDTVKGQMILGGIANIGAQEAANKSRTLNGKDASDINWLNAGAAAITGGAVKNIEKSLNISGSNPVVIIPSMTINAITSGNDKNKPALENEKENKNGKK